MRELWFGPRLAAVSPVGVKRALAHANADFAGSAQHDAHEARAARCPAPVSYTHLTLPTIHLV